MNRKLHNTTMAMIASSSLFVLGLLAATPTVPALSPAPASAMAASFDAASFDADDTVAAAAAGGEAERSDAPRRHVRRSHRQSVAMPFFSFAPRG